MSHLDSRRGGGPSRSPTTSFMITGQSYGTISVTMSASSSLEITSVSDDDDCSEGVEGLFVGEELGIWNKVNS